MRVVGARHTHRYEDRATGRVYVIPAGEARELPDEVASLIVAAHPDKLYFADVAETPGRGATTPAQDRMMRVLPRPDGRRVRRGPPPKRA